MGKLLPWPTQNFLAWYILLSLGPCEPVATAGGQSIVRVSDTMYINYYINQASLSGQGFFSILDDGDRALYLGLALCFKTKVESTLKIFNNQTCI